MRSKRSKKQEAIDTLTECISRRSISILVTKSPAAIKLSSEQKQVRCAIKPPKIRERESESERESYAMCHNLDSKKKDK